MVKVAVLGASGQIGQPLSLLLKSLRLYDVVHAIGVATDLNHIDTPAPVKGYLPENDGLRHALTGAEVVLISAGRYPVTDKEHLFNTNAAIIADLAAGVAEFCPKALVGIITNPVNRVQFGGDEIVKAKAGAGSATTCMAYAGFRFAQAIIKASQGQPGVVEPVYVYLPGIEGGDSIARELGVDYFAVPVSFGANGAETAHTIGTLSDYETQLLKVAVGELAGNIKKGEDFVASRS
ncbi:malate dehydrogenase [Colletotrichum sojae]|uniref:malate dehydrogenase n=1 Tax=Colletotrichum sojae TaxID=2175907 RepID=A0A8H6MSE3_9PEZI|nr:malate dehydrogenase [Colletotrichum sojae]